MYSISFSTEYFKCLMPVNSMKLPGDPWNNGWSVVSMELHGAFPWNSMENVLILHGKY